MTFPTADQVAIAIVTACQFTGDKPFATCMRQTSRARHVAFAALKDVFPEARTGGLARCCGYANPHTASVHLKQAQKAAWWNETWVDEVVGALVGGDYGDQAA